MGLKRKARERAGEKGLNEEVRERVRGGGEGEKEYVRD